MVSIKQQKKEKKFDDLNFNKNTVSNQNDAKLNLKIC